MRRKNMKKIAVIGLALVVVFLSLTACKKAGGADSVLSLIPQDAQGVVVVNVSKAMTTDFVDKAIKENKEYQKYQEFIKETGIDPQKDIFYIAVGLIQKKTEGGETEQQGVVVANMNYNKDVLLAKIKEKASGLKEETYEGVTVYAITEKEAAKPTYGAFLDASNILIGSEKAVKAVIDISKKKADNVFKNADLSALIKTANKNALLWSAFSFPPEMMKDMAAKNPMASDLADVKALLIYFDYANKSLQLEIKGLGGDADKNKKLAETLTGYKALGGMFATEKPEVGELLNKIEVSSAPDYVKIFVNIPEDLLNKLSATAQKQVEEKLAGIKPEEKKEEKK
jgi:hypothetical protein